MGKKHIVCAFSVPDFRVLINGQLCYVASFSGLQRSSFAFYTASHDSRGGGGGGGGGEAVVSSWGGPTPTVAVPIF